MSTTKAFTLALGAALIGSAPGIVIFECNDWPIALGVSFLGILLVLHGTNVFQLYMANPSFRLIRKRRPTIAIISDLDWNENTYLWASPGMSPKAWKIRLDSETSHSPKRIIIRLIKIKSHWQRFILHRYNIIINPYGSVYPEESIKELPIFNSIIEYVLAGGVCVSLSDIPFYWAYDSERHILYDLVKNNLQYIPTEYEQIHGKLILKSVSPQSSGSFLDVPFLNTVRVRVVNTESLQQNEIHPLYHNLIIHDNTLGIENLNSVAINRAILLGNVQEYKYEQSIKMGRIQSIVGEVEYKGQHLSPLCYINFGHGKFITSLLFLKYHSQNNKTSEWLTNLLCKLMLREIKP